MSIRCITLIRTACTILSIRCGSVSYSAHCSFRTYIFKWIGTALCTTTGKFRTRISVWVTCIPTWFHRNITYCFVERIHLPTSLGLSGCEFTDACCTLWINHLTISSIINITYFFPTHAICWIQYCSFSIRTS